jgi:WD40 repeat protein
MRSSTSKDLELNQEKAGLSYLTLMRNCHSYQKNGQRFLVMLLFICTAIHYSADDSMAQGAGRENSLAPPILSKSQLTAPLRTPLKELRFSPNGNYILVQDAAMIYVLTRSPFAVRFAIEARDALPARFSADSNFLLIPTDEGVEARDLTDDQVKFQDRVPTQNPCLVAALSPDGEFYACIDRSVHVHVFRTLPWEQIYDFQYLSNAHLEKTGKAWNWSLHSVPRSAQDPPLPTLDFSTDGKFLFTELRLHLPVAVFLPSKRVVPLAEKVQKYLMDGTLAFIEPDRAVDFDRRDLSHLTLISFPEGRSLRRIALAGRPVSTRDPNYLLVYSRESENIRVVNINTATAVMSLSAERADVSQQGDVAACAGDGKMTLSAVGRSGEIAEMDLPGGILADVKFVSASNDLQSVAVSSPDDGGLYDTWTGKRVFHLGGFQGAWFQNDDTCFLLLDSATRKAVKVIKKLDIRSKETSTAWKRTETWPYFEVTPPEAQLRGSALAGSVLFHSAVGDEGIGFDISETTDLFRIEARDATDGNFDWRRDYFDTYAAPFTSSSGERLVLAWGGKQSRYKQPGNKSLSLTVYSPARLHLSRQDSYFEVVNTKTGKTIGGVKDRTDGSPSQIKNAFSAGNWVAIEPDSNNIVVFALSSGKEVVRSPAKLAAISGARGILALSNDDGRLSFYDLTSGVKESELPFPGSILYMQFSADGSRLLLLTDDQTVYILNLSNRTATPPLTKARGSSQSALP